MASQDENLDVGDDLQITRTVRHAAGSGTWVAERWPGIASTPWCSPSTPRTRTGRLAKAASLWIQRLVDKNTVYNWVRGADIQPADEMAGQIVDFLAGALADHIYP